MLGAGLGLVALLAIATGAGTPPVVATALIASMVIVIVGCTAFVVAFIRSVLDEDDSLEITFRTSHTRHEPPAARPPRVVPALGRPSFVSMGSSGRSDTSEFMSDFRSEGRPTGLPST